MTEGEKRKDEVTPEGAVELKEEDMDQAAGGADSRPVDKLQGTSSEPAPRVGDSSTWIETSQANIAGNQG